jgi:predicted transcriptional regulator
MNDREIFARSLRSERKCLELSREALGFLCDLNMSEISRLERIQLDPTLATIITRSPAMAGVADHIWTPAEIVELSG